MGTIDIIEADASDPRVERMIAIQKAYTLQHSPPGTGYAIDVGSEWSQKVRYFLAAEREEIIGCVGLSPLDGAMGEIKTMHVLDGWRGSGAAKALLEHLIEAARALGIDTIKLETGQAPGYEASRRFYAKNGFEPCERFGRYEGDPESYCMSRAL